MKNKFDYQEKAGQSRYVIFEWDETKSAKNLVKHGITFEEVAERIGGEGFIKSFPNPSPIHPGQVIVLFTARNGSVWAAVVEHRHGRVRLITAQQRRKYRRKNEE